MFTFDIMFWKTFSITRVYLTKTDVSAYASAVVSDYKKNDPPGDYSWAKPCLTIDRVIRRLVRFCPIYPTSACASPIIRYCGA